MKLCQLKFHCQKDRKRQLSDDASSRKLFLKRQKTELVTECLQSQSATETHAESLQKDHDIMTKKVIKPEDQSSEIKADEDKLVDVIKATFTEAAISAIEVATRKQNKSCLWYEMRYGIICMFVINQMEYPLAERNITERVSPYEIQFNEQEFICQPCWRREAYPLRSDRPAVSSDNSDQVIPHAIEDHPGEQPADQPADHPAEQPGRQRVTIHLSQISRAPNTSNSCIVFGCQHPSRLRVPQNMKIRLLKEFNYYVPPAARICQEHLLLNDFEVLLSANNVSHEFNEEQIMDMMNILKVVSQVTGRLDFENIENIDANEVYFLTGRTIEQFNTILAQVPSLLRTCNKPKTALAIYLIKLRTGEPDTRLAEMFHMSRRSLERLLKTARDCLYQDFVPLHLGWDHITRQQVVERNLFIPNALFGDNSREEMKAIIICDGTYVFIQKSSNFLFQKRTYSHHKFQNLLKPFLIVCCDGYIIDVTGPYAATTSDATILSNMLNAEDSVFPWFFTPGDMLILDRGFRDALPDIEDCGYKAHMPLSVPRGQTQLSTTDANKSRMITMCRWVVEVVNGRFKRDFKLFRQDYFNKALPNMQNDFRIAAAITNAFHDPITDNSNAHEIVERINNRMNIENLLAEYVIGQNLNSRRVRFQSMSAELPDLQDFPRLTARDLIIFSLGTYQIKLARSYYAEHARNGTYTIELYRDTEDLPNILNNYNIAGNNFWLLRGRIQSRHRRSRTYYTYILIDLNKRGLEALEHYYCSCKSGRRTLGSCSHIISIVWFLGWARYETISHPAAFLDSVIIDDDI
ncbi:unnamed protein product [Euphydryas editha]|uniref:SWIM-type domain-containing protein n=1 Tax=Euphydryas editha TaxID=104508 RepID=A0AAU9TSQ2_EUPED|nr:unnamed protein product [Euphydryas editha]